METESRLRNCLKILESGKGRNLFLYSTWASEVNWILAKNFYRRENREELINLNLKNLNEVMKFLFQFLFENGPNFCYSKELKSLLCTNLVHLTAPVKPKKLHLWRNRGQRWIAKSGHILKNCCLRVKKNEHFFNVNILCHSGTNSKPEHSETYLHPLLYCAYTSVENIHILLVCLLPRHYHATHSCSKYF